MTAELAQIEEAETGAARRTGARAVLMARTTLFVERTAPAAVIAGLPLALIVLLGLFDLWRFAGLWGHAAALILLLLLSGALFWRRRPRPFFPGRADALARLERDGAMRHEPLRALEDTPAAGSNALWAAHLDDAAERLRKVRLLAPAPSANAVDPFGLRYAVAGLTAIALIVAGPEAPQRIADAFRPSDPAVVRSGFADLWIEPPAYTGKAPVHLLRASDALRAAGAAVEAPEGSTVRIQTKTRARYRLALAGESGTVKAEREAGAEGARATLVLRESGALALSAGGRKAIWRVSVIEDRDPAVAFLETPAADRDGRLVVSVAIDDDYGVTDAALELRLDESQARPLDAPAISGEVASKPERIALEGLKGSSGSRSAAVDLSAHPWAGLAVVAEVVVADGAAQQARTAPAAITLPARAFFNPLAKAVVEQRQTLAVAPSDWRRVEWALSGLTLGPEYFFDRPKDYLLLRSAMWRVNKRGGDDQAQTVEELWPLALQLEDETTELARRRLDAAREALREALRNGASDGEIERLTEALRAALQNYLEALAQSGADDDPDAPPADETVTAADLDDMLNSVRDLAKSGASNAAEQALAELEQLLDNLRAAGRQAGGQSGGAARQGQGEGQGAGALGDLIARQRALADETFRRGETRGADGADLARDEDGLAGELSEMMKALENSDAPGETREPLSRALSAMRRAEGDLSGGNFDGARDQMEEAIANLREGAEALAKAERARQARGQGGEPARDPLGRPVGVAGEGVDVPEKSDAQRARELLLELRRRLSNGERTEDEIDYLERLLERF